MIVNTAKILIIGADRIDDVSLQSCLSNDYQLICAMTASSGLQIFQNVRPDLIILNDRIDDMDKCELSGLLSEFTEDVPIIMNVPTHEMGSIQRWLACSDDLIYSPIIPEIVKMRVKMHLELRGFRSAQTPSAQDPLVGIGTRSLLEDKLGYEWRRALRHQSPQSLILADIDFFGEFNQLYGLAKGDECLRTISSAIAHCVKRETDCVVRFQKDEFAVLLAETDLLGANQVANKMLNALEDLSIPHLKSPVADVVTMSFGVATLRPSKKFSSKRLIANAETLVREAQRGGYNQIKSKLFLL